jgi:saccharopine dehydrogenase (NADP+, L-glutamate forming)
MRYILVLGAGRSSTSLIDYLLKHAPEDRYQVLVNDVDLKLAQEKIGGHALGEASAIDIRQESDRRKLISKCFLVISLLPPVLHQIIAEDCLNLHKHLLTASYLSPELQDLHQDALDKGLLFLTETGLDPGIDHMSAIKLIREIKAESGAIHSFKSYTGGLIEKKSDNNPWHYKITWNPRNVVMAGSQTARLRENGEVKFVPHSHLFREAHQVDLGHLGLFEMYPNRDSISYANIYDIDLVPTIIRGTLRHPGFCKAWAGLVSLGLTDDQLVVDTSQFGSYRDLLQAFLPGDHTSLAEKIAKRILMVEPQVIEQIKWLFDETPLPAENMSVAKLTEHLIIEKWVLQPQDQDLVVMHHEVEYHVGKTCIKRTSSMSMTGQNSRKTAMANLVGLPLGICARLLCHDKLLLRGVHLPVHQEIYLPTLQELQIFGVKFTETKSAL